MSILTQLIGNYKNNKNIAAVRDNYNNEWKERKL